LTVVGVGDGAGFGGAAAVVAAVVGAAFGGVAAVVAAVVGVTGGVAAVGTTGAVAGLPVSPALVAGVSAAVAAPRGEIQLARHHIRRLAEQLADRRRRSRKAQHADATAFGYQAAVDRFDLRARLHAAIREKSGNGRKVLVDELRRRNSGLLRAEAVAFDQVAAVEIADGDFADMKLLPGAGSNAMGIEFLQFAAHADRRKRWRGKLRGKSQRVTGRIVAVFQMLLLGAGIEPHALVVGDAET
jgi:hypothetical protein